MGVFEEAIIDGALAGGADASVPVRDIALLRGYGCFEAMRAHSGVVFRLDEHLRRLEQSAKALRLPLPGADNLRSWVRDRADAGGDCIVRLVVTGGLDPGRPGTASSVAVFAESLPERVESIRVLPVDAPWHTDGARYRLTGAKTLSYAPNVAATLEAVEAGFDDALLVGRSGFVLEGPTFGIAWVADGRLETPTLELGILESITRAVMLEAAGGLSLPVDEGRFHLGRLLDASEAFAMSTTKDITAVAAVGDTPLPAGPVTRRLQAAFDEAVSREVGSH